MIYCCKIAQKLLFKGSFPKIKHKSQEMYAFYALININTYVIKRVNKYIKTIYHIKLIIEIVG